MITQLIHWANMTATALEGLMLLRLLSLKLHRVYTFITLYWAVNLILDGSSWTLGWDSPESTRMQVYGLFLLTVLYPLVAWDALEEMKGALGKVRLLLASRMVSGLFFSTLIAGIFMLFLHDDFEREPNLQAEFFGSILAFVSASAALLFFLNVHRFARKQGIVPARNSAVWMLVFVTVIGCQFAGFVASLLMGKDLLQVAELGVDAISILGTVWGLVRVRAIPPDVSSQPEQASL